MKVALIVMHKSIATIQPATASLYVESTEQYFDQKRGKSTPLSLEHQQNYGVTSVSQ
jgi:hypothetical protein